MAQQDYSRIEMYRWGKYKCITCGLRRVSVVNKEVKVCWICRDKVPGHIPEKQMIRYLTRIGEVVK